MKGAHWNRASRRGGGERPFRIQLPGLRSWLREEIEIHQQRERIRAEFGEEGVKRFDEMLEKKAKGES